MTTLQEGKPPKSKTNEAPNASVAIEDRARPRVMLNEAQVLQIVPVSPSTLSRMVDDGCFPKPTYPSPNRKFWYQDEITAWQNEVNGAPRPRKRRQKLSPKAEQ
jgi:prophage regulatory protein